MANKQLIELIGSLLGIEPELVAKQDLKVDGLFLSKFLQKRIADTLDGEDNLTPEALSQFVYAGLYSDVDPTNERSNIVVGVPAVNHSYPNSVTLNVTRTCHVKCTYCFRGDIIAQNQTYDEAAVDKGIAWIREHGQIGTVVVTGGDPFTLPPKHLRRVVEELAAIPTVNEIRLDSRVLTVKPSTITGNGEILEALAGNGGKVWFYSQINAAGEFHPEVDRAIEEVRRTGVPIINQAVILKGVNDTPVLMKELMVACVSRGIRTDYLYVLDGEEGQDSPFRVEDDEIVEIFRELWSPRTSGLAKPKAVYVNPLTNMKSQLLLSPWDEGSEELLRGFLTGRREKYRQARQQPRPDEIRL